VISTDEISAVTAFPSQDEWRFRVVWEEDWA